MVVVNNLVAPIQGLVRRFTLPAWAEGLLTGWLATLPVALVTNILWLLGDALADDAQRDALHASIGGGQLGLSADAVYEGWNASESGKWAYGWFGFWQLLSGLVNLLSGLNVIDGPADGDTLTLEARLYDALPLTLPKVASFAVPDVSTLLYDVNPAAATIF